MFTEFMYSQANTLILLGAVSTPSVANSYQSYNILQLLPLLLNSPSDVEESLKPTTVDSSLQAPVNYLDVTPSTEQLVYQNESCLTSSNIDYLYDRNYMGAVLSASFAGYDGWNASISWILVDCSYEGRIIGDTTVIKIYILNKSLTQITTFLLQTLSILRPEKHHETSGGAAMWTVSSLSSMHTTSENDIVCSESAIYSVAIGFDFPFENVDFVPVILDSTVPQSGQWTGQVTSTKEMIQFAGTSGLYRRSPTIQGYFNYFYWQLPSNPAEFMSRIQFVVSQRNKDSWGWFRCLLCDGVGINIAINFGVAISVMVNMYRKHSILWIPDVFASLQDRAAIRAALLFVDSVVNGWWYPYQWAINQSGQRYLGGPLDFTENARADGLMVVLAVTYVAAKFLRVRVQLPVVVIIFVACFYTRQSLTQSYGILSATVQPIIEQNYLNNIIPSGQPAMDLWAYHENFTTELSSHCERVHVFNSRNCNQHNFRPVDKTLDIPPQNIIAGN
ncbi:hypothetical protein AeRB84_011318 [Aphanomyces euteiches]|nr:hypothetical protein AeRB84_011318 [Aphanomyces euteiches]